MASTSLMYAIRIGRPEFLNAVVDIDIKSFENAWTAEKWAEVVEDKEFVIAVVTTWGTPVGFAVFREDPDTSSAQIVKIAVKPAARRRGASYHLLVAAVDFTKRRGCFSLSIIVPESLVYPGERSCAEWLKLMEFTPAKIAVVKDHFVSYGRKEDGFRFTTPITR